MSNEEDKKRTIRLLRRLVFEAVSEVERAEGCVLTWPTQKVLREHIARAFEEGRRLSGEGGEGS